MPASGSARSSSPARLRRSGTPTRRLAAVSSLAAAALTAGGLIAAAPAATAAVVPALTVAAGHGWLSTLSAGQVLRLGAHPDDRVIVLLRNQELHSGSRLSNLAARRETFSHDESPLLDELHELKAPDVHSYSLINAVSATVSRAEAARLARSAQVRAVVPDRRVTLPPGSDDQAPAAEPDTSAPAAQPSTPDDEPGICPAAGDTQVEPEARSIIGTPDASTGIDGTGVTVAVFPDGIDPTIPDFQTDGGSGPSVVASYHDFTGEGPSAKTGGGEAFGDVSTIAGQGNETYDLSQEVSKELPIQQACPIKIEGVATGAKVDVEKVFGDTDATFDSVLLQAINYAVNTDRADVLSESFGGNSVPQPADDPISLANQAAVAAGKLVIVSSGDSGTTNTIGSPATSNADGVLSVGATTAFRDIAQSGLYGTPYSEKGWENNNVASLSSAGTTEYGPSSLDLVAPGDSGWADCSADAKTFTDCADYFDAADPASAPPIQLFGGTSESCPLTAGTAALVIEAYKNSHNGDSPSPNLVKSILTSTATPLTGVPADEQGAGLLDASGAVGLAESVDDGTGAATGGVLTSTDRLSAVGEPGSTAARSVTVSNPGSTPLTVTPELSRLGAPTTVAGPSSFTYQAGDPADTTYPSPATGAPRTYVTKTFTVPNGADRLVLRAAWNKGASKVMEVSLFDPDGKLANSSDPQGNAGFAEIEAATPESGQWTAVFYSSSSGYDGPVRWTAYTQSLQTTAAGSPATVDPGGSAALPVDLTLPSSAGDADAVLDLDSTGGSAAVTSQVVVLTRARIPVTASKAGHFSGTLTGGNGRSYFYSQLLPYQFTVPAHTKAINVDASTPASGRELFGFLTDPMGNPVDAQGSDYTNQDGSGGKATRAFHLSLIDPVKGQWHLDVALTGNDVSTATSSTLAGTVNFKPNTISRSGLPNSRHVTLVKGKKRTATITLVNRGNSEEQYFLDPRLSTRSAMLLQTLGADTGKLPMSANAAQPFPVFVMPPFGDRLVMAEDSTVPAYLESFAVSPGIGDEGYPDVISSSASDRNEVTLSSSDLASTGYSCAPQLKGPSAAASTRTTFACAAAAEADGLNMMMSSPTGDLWSTKGKYRPVTVEPGQRRRVALTINVTGKHRVVTGFVAVESFNPITLGTDVVAKLPYTYTVK